VVPIESRVGLRPALPIPWRDPHTVSPAELKQCIARLEQACLEQPHSPELRTCLGMAYAMNLDVYKSMDALEEARELDRGNFWAQMKYSELLYRLRALPRAEEETLRALELAEDARQVMIARGQLKEIRRLIREGTQKPEWSKPLPAPFLVFLAMTVVLCAGFVWGGMR
jgi:hypothetical protein